MKLNLLSASIFCLTFTGCAYHPSQDDSSDQSSAIPGPGGVTTSPSLGSASSKRLITISDDRNSQLNALDLELDSAGNPVGVTYIKDIAGNPTQQSFTSAEIGSGYGVVLEEESGVQAVLLRGQIDGTAGQGLAAIRFITNGLQGTYSECAMRINRVGGTWALYNAYTNALTTSARTITWSLGITTFQGICKQ